jgi:EmrB/QacA subfamily drug resistance transporter
VKRYLVFIMVGLGLLMMSIDSTVVSVALPTFIKELHTNVLWAAWTISLYFIAMTMAMPLIGNMSDSFGRKNVYLFCLTLFTGSSLACGLAPNIYALIVFRLFQGIGGAGLLPTASGIVSDYFPESRDRAIGLFTSIFPIGGIIGPNLGGWIVSRFGWRDIFFINLPIGVALIVASMVMLKGAHTSSRRSVDFCGASFFSGAVLFFMLGINLFAESGITTVHLIAALCLALSLCLAVAFFAHEKGHPNPILELDLLQSKPFVAANIVNLLIGAGILGVFSFIPLYATSVYGISTLMSGMILTPRSVSMIAVSAVTSFMLRRSGYRKPMVWGFAIAALSTILLDAAALIRSGPAMMLSTLMLVSGIGAGMAFPASNNACIELMPERVATIVGLRGMCRMIGAALGVSFITFILHLSPDRLTGFKITFVASALGLVAAIPLAFLVPSGLGQGEIMAGGAVAGTPDA